MMVKNEVYYRELREKSEQMRNAISQNEKLVSKLVDTAMIVLRLSEIARKEGMLSLEEAVKGGILDDLILCEELKKMILLIVDGTDPEIVGDNSFLRYCVRNYQGVEGFLFLLYMDFVLEIQAGTNHMILWDLMISFMPEQVCKELEKIRDEERRSIIKTNEQEWEALYEKQLPVPDSPEEFTTALLDYCIVNMSDEHVKITLDEISDCDLSYSMMLLSGAAYKKLHDNLNEDRREKVIEEKKHMGPCRFRDIGTTNSKVLKKILRLDRFGDIDIPGNLYHILVSDNKVVWQEPDINNSDR